MQGIKVALHDAVDIVGGHIFLHDGVEFLALTLEVPFFSEIDGGVPVDELRDFDRDGDGNGMPHPEL